MKFEIRMKNDETFGEEGGSSSGEQAFEAGGFGDSADGDGVGGGAVVAVGGVGLGVDFVEGFFHDALKLVLNALEIPEVVFQALDPFEIADGDAAGVGED